MTAASTARVLQSAPATALPGTWKLARGRAVTLRPSHDGILRVAHGQVWATMDGPHGRTPSDGGDHILQVGRSMVIKAGQRVVIEAWNPSGASYFAWDPLPAPAAVARPRATRALVLQPLADLRAAVALAGKALGQLARGLAGLAWDWLRGLPARRPHGAAV
jgi:hypothetical protein